MTVDKLTPSALRRRGITQNAMSFGLLPVLLVSLFLLFGIYEPRFWRADNLFNILRNASYLMIISAGQMLVLVIGGLDLSVGAVVALTSVVTALAMVGLLDIMPNAVVLVILFGLVIGLVAGSVVGLINGITVAVFRVSPLIVTVGTMTIAYGIALYITAGEPVYGMPDEFTRGFGRMRWLGLPITAFVTLGFLAAVWWMMSWTKLGRYTYAIGSNEHAAHVSGVPVVRSVITAYVMCSFLAAVTGVLLSARVSSGDANLGHTLMLESIAAAVIGGVSLRGGVGKVPIVAFGALFLALITNGMNVVRVDSKLQTIVIGVVLILAVGLDQWKPSRKRKERV